MDFIKSLCIVKAVRVLCLVTFLFYSSNTIGQIPGENEPDMFRMDLEKNIFRSGISGFIGDDIGIPITFSYEREIIRPFTLVLKAGPVFYMDNNTANMSGYSIHVGAAGELRYYINLLRRIRKNRYVRNFSAYYISIEQTVLSGPILLDRLSREDALDHRAPTFLNIGIQRQHKRLYVNLFAGTTMIFNDEVGDWLTLDSGRIGVTFGFVLFE